MDTNDEMKDGAPAPEAEEAGRPEDGAAQETETEPESAEDKLRAELEAEKDRNIRLLADFDNFRRRTARERNESYERAKESLIEDLLPVMDNFDRAMAQAPADPFADGIKMVQGQLAEFLAKEGVTAIDAVGAKFDPSMHEAIAYQPSDEVDEGVVMFEAKKGYKMGGRVVRAASVIVSSGKPGAEPDEGETADKPEAETEA